MIKNFSKKTIFFIAGAAKCGSSTLYFYLDKHPDIFMSSSKEPAYFAHNYFKGLDWYKEFFAEYNEEKAVGEATVEYMINKNSARRIKNDFPNAKLIFILRNPYERANSHYYHRIKQRNISKDISFEKVISTGTESFPINYGLYYTHLKRFMNIFPRKQIKIILLEDLKVNRESMFQEIFNFLGVDTEINIEYEGDKNTAKIQKSFIIEEVLYYLKNKMKFLKKYPNFTKRLINIYQKIIEFNRIKFNKPKLSPKEVKLLYNYFNPEIEGLEKLLNQKLPQFKRYHGKNIKNYIENY